MLVEVRVRAMPRFYFHIRDGVTLIRDEEGLDLTGEIEARHEAWASASDLAANAARQQTPIGDGVIEVHDEYGTIVYELPIKAVIS